MNADDKIVKILEELQSGQKSLRADVQKQGEQLATLQDDVTAVKAETGKIPAIEQRLEHHGKLLTGLTREGVDAIGQEAVRLREGLAALSALRQREDTLVGIDMVIDAAVALLQAFHDLELALPDAQADVETLEAEGEEDEDGRDV